MSKDSVFSAPESLSSDSTLYQRPRFDPINRIKWIMFYLCIFLSIPWLWTTATSALSTHRESPSRQDHGRPTIADFNWNKSPATTKLEYSPCYSSLGGFQCARLELPLDYWNGTTNETLSLAVIKKPAIVSVTDTRYAGAVIVGLCSPW